MKKPLVLLMATLLTLATVLSISGSAMAQEIRDAPGRNVPSAQSQSQGLADPTELEAFLDELIGSQMEENHIPGPPYLSSKTGSCFSPKAMAMPTLRKASLSTPNRRPFVLVRLASCSPGPR
jgi:hypothetical protein